jgi:hypothetical protein
MSVDLPTAVLSVSAITPALGGWGHKFESNRLKPTPQLSPRGLVFMALDSAGNLYVADGNNNTIRKGFPAISVPSRILQPPSLSAGQFGFGITGLPGLAVNIESSTHLSSWQMVGTKVLVGGTNYYSVSPSPSLGTQFYRAQVR